jgi:glycosyltransferase involved in cell wall biosynthesis
MKKTSGIDTVFKSGKSRINSLLNKIAIKLARDFFQRRSNVKINLENKLELDQGFDARFYRGFYSDLNQFETEEEFREHYLTFGKKEGRFPNSESYIRSMMEQNGPIPQDFVPWDYKGNHKDLLGLNEPWQLVRHYIEFGIKEKRQYKFRAVEIENDYKNFINSTDFQLRYSEDHKPPTEFQELLRIKNISTSAWTTKFNLYEFIILNETWLVYKPHSRMEGIYVFVTRGVERIASIAFGLEFDATFYRHQLDEGNRTATDVSLYCDWLSSGIQRKHFCNEGQAIYHLIGTQYFPDSFQAATYVSNLAKEGIYINSSRFNALMHFFTIGFETYGTSILGTGVSVGFMEDLAKYHFSLSNYRISLKAFDSAIKLNSHLSRLYEGKGDALLASGQQESAYAAYLQACKLPDAEIETNIKFLNVFLTTDYHLDNAIDQIRRSAEVCRGSTRWREITRLVIDRMYTSLCKQADSFFLLNDKDGAASFIETSLNKIKDLIEICEALPARTKYRLKKHAVLIAHRDIPQCDYYRVQQRELQLSAAGWTFETLDWKQSNDFCQFIDQADAIILYRVEASPSILRALTYARALGVLTIYDIDDLIFDDRYYPESYSSYGQQISHDEYRSLQRGVNLFRRAICECDIGIASTPALASLMSDLVRSKHCYIIRNGLDKRNIPFLTLPARPFSNSKLTIFYGSGTTAHSAEFNEILAPALVQILKMNADVRLAIAGYISLDSSFDQYRSRIYQFGFTEDIFSYWYFLSGMDINISILSASTVTDCKSEIKWLEAAMFEIPSVVSPTLNYRETFVDKEDCIFASTTPDWIIALQTLISDPQLRKEIGTKAKSKALSDYDISVAVNVLRDLLPKPDPYLSTLKDSTLSVEPPKSNIGFRNVTRYKNQYRRGTKPRVLIVNVYFPPYTLGGATRVVKDNVDYFIDNFADCIDLAVLTTDDQPAPPYGPRFDSYRGIPVFRLKVPTEPHMDWRSFNEDHSAHTHGVIERFAPDLVHFHCIQRITGTVVEVVRQKNIPYAITCHDAWWISDFQFLCDEDGAVRYPSPDHLSDTRSRNFNGIVSIGRRRHLERLLEEAEVVLCVSNSFAAIYRDAGITNAKALPNGLPRLPKSVERQLSTSGRVRLGHIGGRTTHKGATLIEIALRNGNFDHLELILVDHSLKKGDTRNEVWGETQVTIVSSTPQDKISELYAQIDVLLAPSIWPESFGLVTREAVAHGLWVITSDLGAIGEDVQEDINGFIIDVSNIEGILSVLNYLNLNPDRFSSSPILDCSPKRTVDDQSRELFELYLTIIQVCSHNEDNGPLIPGLVDQDSH